MRKIFIALTALLAVVVMATPAVAGKGKAAKAAKKPAGCKVVTYVFEGTVTSVAADSISADVVEANKPAQAFGSFVTMTVATTTKVVRDDVAVMITDVLTGDSVTLQARACRGVDPTTTTLVASMVDATSPVVPATSSTNEAVAVEGNAWLVAGALVAAALVGSAAVVAATRRRGRAE